MAITAVTNCLGPPPLPPGKRFLQKSSKKLSSTYTSFRDPAVEAWLPRGIFESPTGRKVADEAAAVVGAIATKRGLFKSCSEGDLCAHETRYATTSLDKCIKAIYGSWKNLLHRKCCESSFETRGIEDTFSLLQRSAVSV